jgi:pentatricopeptide repeat-containing protein PET309
MLERTAGCLEPGSLRRVLPGSRNPLKSRRSLHYTFWTHNAIDIELSPLWVALLRGPDHADQPRDTQSNTSNGGGILLDFLYPAGTLNLIRQYSGWGDRVDSRRGKFGLSRFGSRLYTSSAKDTNVKDDSRTQSSSAVEVISEQPMDSRKFQELMGLNTDHEYEKVWQQYLHLDSADRQRLRLGLINYLGPSKSIVESERVVDLFEAILEENRTLDSMQWAIRSYLRLRNLVDATKLHESAIQQGNSLTGSDELLAYLIENSMWSRAFSVYTDVDRLKESFPSTENTVFEAVRRIPKLHVFAANLAAYVDKRVRSKSDASTAEWQSFASKIIRQAMFNVNFDHQRFQNFLGTLQKWNKDTAEIYQDSIRYLLDAKQTNAAIRLYRNTRVTLNLKYSRGNLQALLKVFCTHHSVLGMQQVLDDFFRFHGGPTSRAYRLCMIEFASMGDAETVHSLFDQFIARVQQDNWTLNSGDISSLLNVHAKRGELVDVMKHFDEISSKYNLQPNVVCWNILLHAHAKVNDIKGAFACFEDLLRSKDIVPDAYTFGTLMGICAKNGDLERTVELYRLADNMKIQKSNAMLDVLVEAHIQDDRVAQAEKICEEVLTMSLGGSPTRMWNYLLVAHAMRRDLANVNRILRRMSEANIDYDALTYGALMQALAMVRQPERAYKILKDVMIDSGLKVTHFHYAIVMGGFIATRQFDRVFHVHNRMRRRDTGKSASTKLLTMKAAFQADERLLASSSEEKLSDRAFQLFGELISSMTPEDISTTTWKNAGHMSHDIAYPTAFFSYTLFILSQRNEHAAVSKVYQQFIDLLPERNREALPIGILSALIVSKHRERNFEAVQECWDLALESAKNEGRRMQSVAVPNSTRRPVSESKIIYNRQLELQLIFTTYANNLARQERINDLTTVVNELLREGFVLSNKNWNQYIGLLAQNFQLKKAFTLCENKLMPGWIGWAHIRWTLPERNRLPFEIRALKKEPRYYRPKYHTLLFLAKAWLELQEMSAESRGHQMLVADLERDCPKTTQAIKSMQRLDDGLERSILKGE